MTPRDFVIWLKGFMQAANTFASTPKQWDDIRDQIGKVDLDETTSMKYTPQGNSTVSLARLGLKVSNSTSTSDNEKVF